jgi:large subunit ribosomal protein LP0
MPSAAILKDKEKYHTKVCEYLTKYDKAFLFGADNVASKQFMDIRKALRPASTILMGKNTMMKRSIRIWCEETGSDKWACLLDHLVGNVGILFIDGEFTEIREEVLKFKIGAPARFNTVAMNDVFIRAGPTPLDPSQTSFFQALNIGTKINKGSIEIVSDIHLIKVNERVSASAATLLSKLGIKPFKYGLNMMMVCESGSMYDIAILDITDDLIVEKVMAGIQTIASVCLAIGYPTLISIPHSVINGYKNVLAIALATDYSFPLADKVKDILSDPTKLAALQASASASAAPAAGAAAAPAAPQKAAVIEESEEEDMGFSLFD